MCAVFGISRSGYYDWTLRKESGQSKCHERHKKQIRRIFLGHRRLYGSKKISGNSLKKQGVQVTEKTVARIMKELGLKSRTVKKYKATTNSKHILPVAASVLNQQFQASAPKSGLDDRHHLYPDR
ncbi:IS3 family transposase [Paenibacillus sp. A3]|uniref:IS3 family transposase n=1 Tax=Paenibacillus sp. A3 TaxID=1337054 RepID=UPI0009E78364